MTHKTATVVGWILLMAIIDGLARHGIMFETYTKFQRFLYVTLIVITLLLVNIEDEATS